MRLIMLVIYFRSKLLKPLHKGLIRPIISGNIESGQIIVASATLQSDPLQTGGIVTNHSATRYQRDTNKRSDVP